MQEGFHEFIDRLQIRLNEVGVAIDESLLSPQKVAHSQSQSQAQSQRFMVGERPE
jgi:hypothetical protein